MIVVGKTYHLEMITVESDRAIREAICRAIDKENWAAHTTIQIAVTMGVVELRGLVADQSERARLNELALHVSGVTNVVDRLTIIEPPQPCALKKPQATNDVALAALLMQ
jgi:osmotically-inducible protein OsmY